VEHAAELKEGRARRVQLERQLEEALGQNRRDTGAGGG